MQMGLSLGINRNGKGAVFQPDFYVSSATDVLGNARTDAGSDVNDGLTPSSAFATLAKAETEAVAIGNGAKIGLVAGSFWRETLDLSSLSFVEVRGTGDLLNKGFPLIRASDVIAGPWSTSADRADANTNVYSKTLTWEGGTATFPNAWENDLHLSAASSLANCQATPGTFWTSAGVSQNASGTAQTFYIHPFGSTNPNTDLKRYEYAARFRAVYLGDDCSASYIRTDRQTHADGSLVAGERFNGIGTSSAQGVKHESLAESGRYYKCIGWHPEDDNRTNNIVMEFYSPNGTGLDCVYDRCMVQGPGVSAAQAVTAYSGHNAGPGTYYDSVSGFNIVATECAAFLEFEAQESLTLHEGHSVNCKTGVYSLVGGASPPVITDFWYHTDKAFASSRVVTGANNNAVIDGLRMYSSGTTSFDGVDFTSNSLTIQSSVMVFNNADGFSNLFRFGNLSGKTVSIKESIVERRANNVVLFEWYTAGHQVLGTRQNNVYYSTSASAIQAIIGGTSYGTAALYLAANPESGTITTNPGLVDPANGDFSLSAPLANGAGLQRFPDYIPTPPSRRAAEIWAHSGREVGSEKITNGGFDSDTSWTKNTGWTITGGSAVATAVTGFNGIFNAGSYEQDKQYLVIIDAQVTSGTLAFGIGSSGQNIMPADVVTGVSEFVLTTSATITTNQFYFRANPSFTGSINSVSVREIL